MRIAEIIDLDRDGDMHVPFYGLTKGGYVAIRNTVYLTYAPDPSMFVKVETSQIRRAQNRTVDNATSKTR